MSFDLTTDNLKRALELRSKIDSLTAEFEALTRGEILPPRRRGRQPKDKSLDLDALPKRRVSPLKGRKRPVSSSGPLGPAVIKILTEAGRPMTVNEILDGLNRDAYAFTAPDPKKNLYARVHTLKGVKRVDKGLFTLDA